MTRGLRVHAGAAWVVVVCHALVSGPASAQSSGRGAEGTVLQVEKDDLVVDLGGVRGAHDGDVVELWRPLRIRHPITGKVLVDRFLIGKLHLVQVRPSLSLAQAQGELSRPAQTGDVVVLDRPAPPPAAAPPTSTGETRGRSCRRDPPRRRRARAVEDVRRPARHQSRDARPSLRRLRHAAPTAAISRCSGRRRACCAGSSRGRAREAGGSHGPGRTIPCRGRQRAAARRHGRPRRAPGRSSTRAPRATTRTSRGRCRPSVRTSTRRGCRPGAYVRRPSVVRRRGRRRWRAPRTGRSRQPGRAEVRTCDLPRRSSSSVRRRSGPTTRASTSGRRGYVWQTEGVLGGRLEDVGLRRSAPASASTAAWAECSSSSTS